MKKIQFMFLFAALGLLATQTPADPPCGPVDQEVNMLACNNEAPTNCKDRDGPGGLCKPLSVTIKVYNVAKCVNGLITPCASKHSACLDEYALKPVDPIASVVGGWFVLVPVKRTCLERRNCLPDLFDFLRCTNSIVTEQLDIPSKIDICCSQ